MKKVIAYLHTHWDREWYREYEVFRLRLLRVFDNILELLQNNKIPSFYFDGQTSALLDYLEIRPEKKSLVKKLVKEKRLFIGPFYCLIDEFLTDKTCFKKNLEIGLKISKEFGCEDFIGYFADTFGHSQNIPDILKEFGIDKAIVWRGVKDLPSEFLFNGVKTVNLIRGYFMDIFASELSVEEKSKRLKAELDLIAEKSSDVLLLPIGADHLGVPKDISEQISAVNKILTDYKIELGSPFDYFKLVKFKHKWDKELRDNSKTFILSGSYSARTKLKQYNTECMYKLDYANKLQKTYGSKYDGVIEYAYRLLLQNQAHDSICGCSTDAVHRENVIRYEKILQISNTIVEELKLEHNIETPVIKSSKQLSGYEVVKKEYGVENNLLYDTMKIPVTEDFKTIYTLKKKLLNHIETDLFVKEDKLWFKDVEIRFTRCADNGDTYNFGPEENDIEEVAKIFSYKNGIIKTDFFNIKVSKGEKLLHFNIKWNNKFKNKLWQVKFILPKPVKTTFSEDMNSIIEREFDCNYNIRQHLPKTKGIEVKTNFAPMQRYVGTQGFGVITKGLTEYEVFKNTLGITLLRSIGIISNPKNPARSTPAGPPIQVPEAQQLGCNSAEFAIGFFTPKYYQECVNEVFPDAY